MSDKNLSLTKPSIPLRPKNLVVLNSKHLPKPPETFSSENVTNFIKDLNLDVKDEEKVRFVEKKCESSILLNKNIVSSDGEESYKCLDPKIMNLPVVYTNKFFNEKLKEKIINKKQFKCDVSEKSTSHENSGCFVTKPIFVNLIRRICYEMRELKFTFNRNFTKAFHTISKRGKNYSKVISVPTTNKYKPQVPQNFWHRPLPLLPKETKSAVTDMPWYKNVDRKKGEQILKNGIDGYFLVRPSSNSETYLTLTLWYNQRVYNIPIRKRKDGKFALGTPKANEQSFCSVEVLIKNYQSEKLVLYSNGEQTGKTLLTTFPS